MCEVVFWGGGGSPFYGGWKSKIMFHVSYATPDLKLHHSMKLDENRSRHVKVKFGDGGGGSSHGDGHFMGNGGPN